MKTQAELIESCLELIAAKTDDLAPAVYRKFFKQYPQAEELFGYDPGDVVKGAMIVRLLMELMFYADGMVYPENIKRWLSDHKAYGVTLPMYVAMFDCLKDEIKALLGDAWTQPMDEAWNAQCAIVYDFLPTVYTDSDIATAASR